MKGTVKANVTIAALLIRRYLLGLLFQKGFLLVLITKTTRTCEQRDSINHAVWNKCSGYWGFDNRATGIIGINTKSIVKKVKKSKREGNVPAFGSFDIFVVYSVSGDC